MPENNNFQTRIAELEAEVELLRCTKPMTSYQFLTLMMALGTIGSWATIGIGKKHEATSETEDDKATLKQIADYCQQIRTEVRGKRVLK